MNKAKVLHKLNHWSAWLALALVLAFVITGYGMTLRLFDPALAKLLHGKILPIPLFLALLVHGTLSAMHAMHRWHVFKNPKTANAYVLSLSLVLLGLFLWLYLR